ncbi:MAG: hypothetical protein MH208_00450 [Marinobacter sp.]|nr:hypothetical protein [Marinobacter sp.]
MNLRLPRFPPAPEGVLVKGVDEHTVARPRQADDVINRQLNGIGRVRVATDRKLCSGTQARRYQHDAAAGAAVAIGADRHGTPVTGHKTAKGQILDILDRNVY